MLKTDEASGSKESRQLKVIYDSVKCSAFLSDHVEHDMDDGNCFESDEYSEGVANYV